MGVMKKRITSLLLAMTLALGLAVPAWAQSESIVGDVPGTSLTLSAGQELEAARRLYDLGLFRGVGTDPDGTTNFDLDRTPTRVEGVVMLVRLLGRDKEGQKDSWTSPFTDVPGWASSYVGYAYNARYTKGTSATTFGSLLPIDAAQYLTLVLRAMGYIDGEDFQWDSPWTLSNRLGITDYDPANPGTFTLHVDSEDPSFTMDDVEWEWDKTRLDVEISGSGAGTRTVRITGLKEGDAALECYAGSSGGALELHVNPAGPERAIYIYGGVDGDVRELEVGKSYTMSVINKRHIEGSDDYDPLPVKYWTLSDPSLADLDGGDLRPKAPGVLTITAVLADGESLSTDVTIREQPPKPEKMRFEGPDLPANFKEYDANGALVYDVTVNSINFRFHYLYGVLHITDCDFTINYLAPGVVEVPITYTLTNQDHEVADQGQLYFRLENGIEKWTYSSVDNLWDGNVYTVTLSN